MKSHPRNYFFFTGIGKTKRKFADYNEINWDLKVLDEEKSEIYCNEYISEITKFDGYLDTAFSTKNPILKPQKTETNVQSLIIANSESYQKMPFRTVLGISGGADSSFVAELVCKALDERYKNGMKFQSDQLLFISFYGKSVNKTDTKEGQKFIKYLQKKYPHLPIVLEVVKIDTSDFKNILSKIKPKIPRQEHTGNILVAMDFHKASLLNQVAEAYNFLHIDTTNLTEEAIGETTDGTGGFGQVAIARLPKSLIYKCLDILKTPINLGRNSLDTCTSLNKTEQYLTGKRPKNLKDARFFEIFDQVILFALYGFTSEETIKKTGHSKRFIENTFQRIYLSLQREKTGGYSFGDNWQKEFSKNLLEFKDRYWNFQLILKEQFNVNLLPNKK